MCYLSPYGWMILKLKPSAGCQIEMSHFLFFVCLCVLEPSKPIMYIEFTGLVRTLFMLDRIFPECRIIIRSCCLWPLLARKESRMQLVNVTWNVKSVFCAWVNMLPLLVRVSVATVPLGQVAYNRLLDPVFLFLDQWSLPDSLIRMYSTEIDILHLHL